MMNFVEELRWRGMLHDIMPDTEDYLLKLCTNSKMQSNKVTLSGGKILKKTIFLCFHNIGENQMEAQGD